MAVVRVGWRRPLRRRRTLFALALTLLALSSTACSGRTPAVPDPATPSVTSSGSSGGCVAKAGQLLVRQGTPYPLRDGDNDYRVGLQGKLAGEPPRVRLSFTGTSPEQASSQDVAAGDTVTYLGFTIAVVDVCPSSAVLEVTGSSST